MIASLIVFGYLLLCAMFGGLIRLAVKESK